MTILVTGATGNIGRCVVDRLVGDGQRVRAMTRDPQTARLAAGVEVVHRDFERPETWLDVLDGVECVSLFPFFAYYAPESQGNVMFAQRQPLATPSSRPPSPAPREAFVPPSLDGRPDHDSEANRGVQEAGWGGGLASPVHHNQRP